MTDSARVSTMHRLNPDVIAKRLDEAMILVHITTSRIFELNQTAGRVWELLEKGLDADAIVRQLTEEFDVEGARAANQVNSLLLQLRSEGLLLAS